MAFLNGTDDDWVRLLEWASLLSKGGLCLLADIATQIVHEEVFTRASEGFWEH